MRLVLSENADPQITGIDEVGEHETDQPIGTTEGNCGFGPVRGQRVQPLALTAGQDNAQHVWRFPHGSKLSAVAYRCQRNHAIGRCLRVFGSAGHSPEPIVPPDSRAAPPRNYGAGMRVAMMTR